jgi:hypothetical protein
MAEASGIDAARRRLALALDALEAALDQGRGAGTSGGGLSAQLHALATDRSRLAAELDAAVARARSLESTNREVAERLDAAIATIRSVLETNQH